MRLASFLFFVFNILRIGQRILFIIENCIRNRKIKKKYKESHDAIEKGDIDKINDMLKNYKN
jgi:hypothetical protein